MRCLFASVLVAAIATVMWPGSARPQGPADTPAGERQAAAAMSRFELKDGDRVVFIGDTFFEREGRYGYIETMLTVSYPGKRITFRNLGWSGDTVWGESRGYFEPEKGYQNLIELVAELEPTVIFLAYGNNEAFAGEEGLEPFIKQYNKLLDDLERFTKRIVLLHPIPHRFPQTVWKSTPGYGETAMLGSGVPDERGTDYRLYDEPIKAIARQRSLHFIDLPAMLRPKPVHNSQETISPLSDDGTHLNPFGYWRIAQAMEAVLRLPYDQWWWIYVNDRNRNHSTQGMKVARTSANDDHYVMEVLDNTIPFPSLNYDRRAPRQFSAQALEPGIYELFIDGKSALRQSNMEWKKPHVLRETPELQQAQKLRAAIIAKNELFFYRWRPQNTTYLLGFRKHEQGQNAKEIAQFDPLIAAKEEEIFKLAQPVAHKYELIRVKEDGAKNRSSEKGGDK